MRVASEPALTPARQWEIVLARDRRYDGTFVYAVRSTGVYCRPSCPSRRPRRSQVTFFPIAEAAEREGFRPCRRCRPEHANGGDPAIALVRAACAWIDAHADAPTTLPRLAAAVGSAPRRLVRAFRRVLGISPREYRDARRLERFKRRLRQHGRVGPALFDAGYGSTSRLYERAPTVLGMTPATYGRGGRGTEIRYTIVNAPLGRLLVAATRRGICRIGLGGKAGALAADLRTEFPAATLRRDTATLDAWVRPILRHLAGREPHLDLPLDVRATAFQQRVWAALRKIPYGETRSYAEIARRIGRPRATRAVARACASNPTALLIPCHRVVRADGELGGYRWGVERKRALLKREEQTLRR